MSMCHVHRSAFVAYIDDGYVSLRQLVPDGLDVGTLKTKYPIDFLRLQKIDNQFGD